MVSSPRLLWRLAGASLSSQMQDRGAFAMQALVGFIVNIVEFVAIALLFRRFGPLAGWSLPELALLYGQVHIAFACADGLSGGFDTFGNLVRTGEFDRILLRPRNSALQVAGLDFQLRRVGRLLQGAAVFAWGAARAHVAWGVAPVGLLIAAALGGTCLFYGVFVLQATLAFWTTETLEVMNVLTYGGVEQAQFPLTIFRAPFRVFFTAVVPVACINYFPLIGVLGRVDPLGTPAWLPWVSPLAGPLFLTAALAFWRHGERHYRSAGS